MHIAIIEHGHEDFSGGSYKINMPQDRVDSNQKHKRYQANTNYNRTIFRGPFIKNDGHR